MLVSVALFSGFTRVSTVPAGSLPKAALVGANTVNGPLPSRVSTRPAALTAATSVVWSFEWIAFSMMFLEGYIAAPPTMTVFSCALTGATMLAVRANAPKAAAVKSAIRLDMVTSPDDGTSRRLKPAMKATTVRSILVWTASSLRRVTAGCESRFQGINFRTSETIFGGIRVCVARADSRHDMSALLPEHSGKEFNEIIV